MKKKVIILIAIVGMSMSTHAQRYQEMIENGDYSFYQIQEEAESYFDLDGRGKSTGYFRYKRWEYHAEREVDESGFFIDPFQSLKSFEKFQSKQSKQKIKGNTAEWKGLGPTYWNRTSGWNPGNGRITSIAVDEHNYNHIVAGAITGGVWKTIDKGENWTPLSDSRSSMVVSAVAIDPQDSDIYYWGGSSGRVHKSTDAGQTWELLTSLGPSLINKILIHPTNSNIMYASCEYSGIFRTEDGGVTWGKINTHNFGYDIQFKPGNPNVVYASGKKLYKSSNGGVSFVEVSTPFSIGPKMIGVSIDDTNRIYVLEAFENRFGGIYKSINGGSTFSKLSHIGKNYLGDSENATGTTGQAPKDMAIAVSPSNADEVHIGGIGSWRSMDAGTTFEITSHWSYPKTKSLNIGYCHADVDIMLFYGNTLYLGTDGGVYISENTNATVDADYFTDISSGLGIRQFYRIGISQTSPVVVTGGAHDNGTSVLRGSSPIWYDWLGADGMESFVDWSNPNHLYGTSQFGTMYQSYNGGLTYSEMTSPDGKRGSWLTPFEQDPVEANTIYVGMNQVYKKNGSTNWEAISQNFGGNLTELKIAKSNNKVMYASKGGSLYKTTTGVGTWTQLTGVSGFITFITIHPTDANKVAVTIRGGELVYVTKDGGDTWTSFKKNLPTNLLAFSAVWDNEPNNGLYLGMTNGVFYINDDLTDWELFSEGIPNVKVSDLEIHQSEKKIYAATYGRGVWVSKLRGPEVDELDFTVNNTTVLSCDDVVYTLKNSTASSHSWDFGTGAVPATANGNGPHSVHYTTVGSKTVSLQADGGMVTKDNVVTVLQNQSIVPTVTIDIIEGENPSCDMNTVVFKASAQNEGATPVFKWIVGGVVKQEGTSKEFSLLYYQNGDKVSCELLSSEECVANDVTQSNDATLVLLSCTGVEEQMGDLKIYPNPVEEVLYIELMNSGGASWILYDVNGRVFNSGELMSGKKKNQIDMSSYTKGIYFISLKTNQKSIIKEVLKR